ncbi:hypothetical protein BC629DRAFT_1589181 [Irpex lacteus]|nr:hypothetical protein BC629DRAFT_1589181 [Irpex lacteus]
MHLPAKIEHKEYQSTRPSNSTPKANLVLLSSSTESQAPQSSLPLIVSRMVNVPSFSRYVQSELSALLEDSASLGVNTAAPGVNPSTSAKILHRRWGVCTKNLRIQGQMVNYVAAVFIGALITMLQDSVVSTNSLAQPVATVSLLCALASLCWGVVLYMHVARRRHVDETRTWLFNAVRIRSMWWNVETMFTLPLVWLLW